MEFSEKYRIPKARHILLFKGFHLKRKSPQGDLKQETYRKHPVLTSLGAHGRREVHRGVHDVIFSSIIITVTIVTIIHIMISSGSTTTTIIIIIIIIIRGRREVHRGVHEPRRLHGPALCLRGSGPPITYYYYYYYYYYLYYYYVLVLLLACLLLLCLLHTYVYIHT